MSPPALRGSHLAFLGLSLAACSGSGTVPGRVPESPPSSVSGWGTPSGGLACRVRLPGRAARGDILSATVEFRFEAAALPPGTTRFDLFELENGTRLLLRDPATGATAEVRPDDPSCGMPPMREFDEAPAGPVAPDGNGNPPTGSMPTGMPSARECFPLSDGLVRAWEVEFPLAKAWEALPAGEWEAQVEVIAPERSRCPLPATSEGKPVRAWAGTVSTGALPLAIAEPAPRTERFRLPLRLSLRKGSCDDLPVEVSYGTADAETLDLPVRNGFMAGAKFYRGDFNFRLGGPPEPDSPNAIDQLSRDIRGPWEGTYTIEVFESADPPMHGWMPGPGRGSYRVLWKKTLQIAATAEEFLRLRC